MALPESCNVCGPDGGYWAVSEKGVARCGCRRGIALLAQDMMRKTPPRPNVDPIISQASAMVGVSILSIMPFFPFQEPAQMVIANQLRMMCHNDDELMWLCERAVELCSQWKGLPMLRAIFCSKYFPLDGKDAPSDASIFPDGVPPEISQAAPARAALPPGHVASVDRELDSAIKDLAERKKLN